MLKNIIHGDYLTIFLQTVIPVGPIYFCEGAQINICVQYATKRPSLRYYYLLNGVEHNEMEWKLSLRARMCLVCSFDLCFLKKSNKHKFLLCAICKWKEFCGQVILKSRVESSATHFWPAGDHPSTFQFALFLNLLLGISHNYECS